MDMDMGMDMWSRGWLTRKEIDNAHGDHTPTKATDTRAMACGAPCPAASHTQPKSTPHAQCTLQFTTR
jgi:hypothetical protein